MASPELPVGEVVAVSMSSASDGAVTAAVSHIVVSYCDLSNRRAGHGWRKRRGRPDRTKCREKIM